MASVGLAVALAQAAQMDPPTMTQGPGAAITVSWLPVAPVGANDTTYTLSYDTSDPFTATQTVTTIDTSYVINGVDGVTYYAIVQADDGSGVLSDPSGVSQVTADGTAPNSSFVPLPASPNGANGWYTSATAKISVVETNSGLQSLTVNTLDVSADVVFGLPPDPSTYAVTLAQGVNDFLFAGIDVAGNIETPDKTASLKLDSVIPTCAVSVTPSTPTSAAITAAITAGDAAPGSGVDHIEYVFLPIGTSPNGSTVWTSAAGASVSPSVPAARRTLFARSVDVAGNVSAVQSADVLFDATAPVTTMVTVPASPDGPAGSWLHAPSISLSAVDTDPSTTTYFSWNNTDTVATVGTAPVVPAGAGVQTLRFFSVDSAGNAETVHVVTFLVQDQQSYTITFNSNGGSAVAPVTQLFGSAVATPTAPTLAGSTFAGWYSDAGLTTPYTFTTMPAANITLYAKWTGLTYSIAFNSNGGSAVATITQTAGSAVTTPTAPTKTGNTFSGWYSDAGLTTPYTFTTMPAANITLYAKWTVNTYSIAFNSNGGSAVATVTQAFGSAVSAPTAPTRANYTFAGWYSDAGLTTPYAFTTMPAANITLYAKWTGVSHTITFVTNGGSAVTAITQPFGSTVVAPTAPTKAGSLFAGWYSDANLTTLYFFTTMPASDITLYAKWALNSYTLTYTAGLHGAISGTSPQTVTFGSSGTTVTAVADPGFHFVSWSDGLTTAARRDSGLTGNLTVSASFAADALIHPRVVLKIRTSAHRGRTFAIVGDVTPATAGQPIIIQYKKPGSTLWVTAKYSPVFTRSGTALGHFGLMFSCKMLGTWKFRARFAPDATHTGFNAYDSIKIIR